MNKRNSSTLCGVVGIGEGIIRDHTKENIRASCNPLACKLLLNGPTYCKHGERALNEDKWGCEGGTGKWEDENEKGEKKGGEENEKEKEEKGKEEEDGEGDVVHLPPHLLKNIGSISSEKKFFHLKVKVILIMRQLQFFFYKNETWSQNKYNLFFLFLPFFSYFLL